MAFYGILTELADDRQPYNVLPDFAKLDLGGATTFQMRWPGNNADDVKTIDVFGALADSRIDLQVVRNEVGPDGAVGVLSRPQLESATRGRIVIESFAALVMRLLLPEPPAEETRLRQRTDRPSDRNPES